jgi:hypothetical protein
MSIDYLSCIFRPIETEEFNVFVHREDDEDEQRLLGHIELKGPQFTNTSENTLGKYYIHV